MNKTPDNAVIATTQCADIYLAARKVILGSASNIIQKTTTKDVKVFKDTSGLEEYAAMQRKELNETGLCDIFRRSAEEITKSVAVLHKKITTDTKAAAIDRGVDFLISNLPNAGVTLANDASTTPHKTRSDVTHGLIKTLKSHPQTTHEVKRTKNMTHPHKKNSHQR